MHTKLYLLFNDPRIEQHLHTNRASYKKLNYYLKFNYKITPKSKIDAIEYIDNNFMPDEFEHLLNSVILLGDDSTVFNNKYVFNKATKLSNINLLFSKIIQSDLKTVFTYTSQPVFDDIKFTQFKINSIDKSFCFELEKTVLKNDKNQMTLVQLPAYAQCKVYLDLGIVSYILTDESLRTVIETIVTLIEPQLTFNLTRKTIEQQSFKNIILSSTQLDLIPMISTTNFINQKLENTSKQIAIRQGIHQGSGHPLKTFSRMDYNKADLRIGEDSRNYTIKPNGSLLPKGSYILERDVDKAVAAISFVSEKFNDFLSSKTIFSNYAHLPSLSKTFQSNTKLDSLYADISMEINKILFETEKMTISNKTDRPLLIEIILNVLINKNTKTHITAMKTLSLANYSKLNSFVVSYTEEYRTDAELDAVFNIIFHIIRDCYTEISGELDFSKLIKDVAALYA